MSIRHVNAPKGSVEVTGSGSQVTQGVAIPRLHENRRGRLVVDSPPYVQVTHCPIVKKDGTVCHRELKGKNLSNGLCAPHRMTEVQRVNKA